MIFWTAHITNGKMAPPLAAAVKALAAHFVCRPIPRKPIAKTRGQTGPSRNKRRSIGAAMAFAETWSVVNKIENIMERIKIASKRMRGGMIRQRGAKRKRPIAKVLWPTRE